MINAKCVDIINIKLHIQTYIKMLDISRIVLFLTKWKEN